MPWSCSRAKIAQITAMGLNFTSHTRKMRVKKSIFSILPTGSIAGSLISCQRVFPVTSLRKRHLASVPVDKKLPGSSNFILSKIFETQSIVILETVDSL